MVDGQMPEHELRKLREMQAVQSVPRHTPSSLGSFAPPVSMPDIHFTVTIPGEMGQYANDIRRFIDAMVFKLEKNAHKGKWESLSVQQAADRLEEEVKELRAELGGNTMKIVMEAADVANFAMIAASIAIERGK